MAQALSPLSDGERNARSPPSAHSPVKADAGLENTASLDFTIHEDPPQPDSAFVTAVDPFQSPLKSPAKSPAKPLPRSPSKSAVQQQAPSAHGTPGRREENEAPGGGKRTMTPRRVPLGELSPRESAARSATPRAATAAALDADDVFDPEATPLPPSGRASPGMDSFLEAQWSPVKDAGPSNGPSSPVKGAPLTNVAAHATKGASPAKHPGPMSKAPGLPPPPSYNSPVKEYHEDDTCLSTFSMAPDLTRFATLPTSPAKPSGLRAELETPRAAGSNVRPVTPGTARPAVPARTPRGDPSSRRRGPPAHPSSDDATTQLLEFTEPLAHAPLRSPHKRGSGPATASSATAGAARAAPYANLLDFDLPPAPTPRSVPTITARELESLKAAFLSEIGSLRATLSGREAEIRELVRAKDDAERRHGRAQEELREVRDARATLEDEKNGWEKRDKELKEILRGVKEELLHREREREDLAAQLETRGERAEAAEARAAAAESQLAGLQARAADVNNDKNNKPGPTDGSSEASPATPQPADGAAVQRAVDEATTALARELHELYRRKHESKVAALKRSYEGRWEKRTQELQRQVDALTKENEELRLGRDATMSGVVPAGVESEQKRLAREAELQALRDAGRDADVHVAELVGQADRLETEAARLRRDNAQLRADLAATRREHGELVATVEQMLVLQQDGGNTTLDLGAAMIPGSVPMTTTTTALPAAAVAAPPAAPAPLARAASAEDARPPSRPGSRAGLLPKPSGLRGPGFGLGGGGGAGESRIGTMKRSVSGTAAAPASASVSRSGIMSNIERMGRGRGAAD